MIFPVKLEKGCRSCRRNRQGAAAVEFAIVAPVFFLMVFGMIEFGRAIMVQQVLTNAAREGARVGILDSTTSVSDVITAVNAWLTGAQLPAASATITMNPNPPSSAKYGDPVTVTVQIPWSSVSWLPTKGFLGSNVKLSATTVMRRETIQQTTTGS